MEKLSNPRKVIFRIIIFIVSIILITFLFMTDFNSYATKVYLNGNIYTLNEQMPKANSIAIKGQKILYVGSKSLTKNYISKKTKIINLHGQTVIPGIIESHMHLSLLGESLLKLNLNRKPLNKILTLVKNKAQKTPKNEWIQGIGWNNEVWENKNFPTKEMLDKVSPNNPVMLERTDGHMVWVNSLALKVAKINNNAPNPNGGEYLRDKNGDLTGCVTDNAIKRIEDKIPNLSNHQQKGALLAAQKQMFKYGITSCVDAVSPVSDIKNMKIMYRKNKFKLRVYCLVGSTWGGDSTADAQIYYRKGPELGLFDNRLTVRAIKIFADGSLGARSAALLKDYSDDPGNKGTLMYSDKKLYNRVKNARKYGFQVAIHAIGDAAIKQTINIYEKVLNESPLNDHRYRIEHFQVASINDIERLIKLKFIPSMQPTHATSDKNMAENRVGPKRILGAYAWQKLLTEGSIIISGSDAPVESANPYEGLYAAVTRKDKDGNPSGGWYPVECMTREEALKSFTTWAAYGQFAENIKGSLTEGKLADFTLIDRDYFKCKNAEIKDIKTLETVIGGETVYKAPM